MENNLAMAYGVCGRSKLIERNFVYCDCIHQKTDRQIIWSPDFPYHYLSRNL